MLTSLALIFLLGLAMAALCQQLIRTGTHVLQVGLVLPEVLFRNLVSRKDGQEIIARRQRSTCQDQTSSQKKLCIYFLTFHDKEIICVHEPSPWGGFRPSNLRFTPGKAALPCVARTR